jgi:hypothetical protein
VQCVVVQHRREFGGVVRGERLEVEPFRPPALVKIDHPSTITAERAWLAGGCTGEAEFVEV